MTTPHTPPAALDVAAAPDARDNLRRVRAMYDAAPPEGCDDGDRTPALERVVASLAGGYSTSDLDARDVRCLVVAFDDAEQIINALQGQAALLRGEVNELRAKVADLTGDYETRCDETRRLGDELLAGLAGLAGEIVDALARAAAAEAECARLTTERDAARAEAAGLRAAIAALRTERAAREAAEAQHAALAGAVRAEREALSAEWDAASEHHSEMWAETYYATKPPARAATARLTALLAAAPPRSTVDARVVREYLAADAAHWREINNVNGLHDPGRAGRCAATQGTRDAARAALDAALAGCV